MFIYFKALVDTVQIYTINSKFTNGQYSVSAFSHVDSSGSHFNVFFSTVCRSMLGLTIHSYEIVYSANKRIELNESIIVYFEIPQE